MSTRREALGDGEVYRRSQRWTDPDGNAWTLTTRYGVVEDRVECIGVSLDAPPSNRHAVTRDTLRAVQIGTVVSETRRRALAAARQLADDPTTPAKLRAEVRRVLPAYDRGKRKTRTTPTELEKVARVYADAYAKGEPTGRAVADALGISPSTARKKVMAAREAGLLGAAVGRRPGVGKVTSKKRKGKR